MSNSGISPATPLGRMEPHTDEAHVVYTRRRVPTNWVSGMMLQPSIEPLFMNSSVPSDLLVEDQVSRLGTAQPLLTISFISKCFFPLHVKRKTSSSVMDGLLKRE